MKPHRPMIFIRQILKTAVLCLAVTGARADDAGELTAMLERLRLENPGEYQKVQRLAETDRDSALRFLRGRFGGAPPKIMPSKVPADPPNEAPAASGKLPGLLPSRRERFEKFDTIQAGEFAIDLCRRDDGAFGLGEIRRGAVSLRRADFLVTWRVNGKFPRFESRAGRTIHLREPEATLSFVPERRVVAGTTFAGLRLSLSTAAGPVVETASWELGGNSHGLSFFDGYRGWHAPPVWSEADALPETNPKLAPSLLHGTGFQFEHGPAGALVSFHTSLGDRVRTASRGEALEFETTFNGAPEMSRFVFTATGDSRINLWTRAFELCHAELRWALDLPEPAREILVRWPPFSRRGFAETAEECAARTAEDGFTGVLLDTVWDNLEVRGGKKNLNTLDYAICEAYGGEAGLRALMDACHRRGLRVIVWTPAAHLVNSSPVWQAHPDWAMRDATGEFYKNPSGLRHGALDTGFAGYFRERVTGAVKKFGFDGLWMDSHLPYAGQARPPDHGARLASLYRDFIKAGARQFLVEGDASAIGACSILMSDEWAGRLAATDLELLSGSALVTGTIDAQVILRHFRRMAAGGAPWMVDWDFLHSPKLAGGDIDAARSEVRRVLADWNRVRDRMQHRFVHADGSGFTWTHDRDAAKVVWLLRDAKLPDGQPGKAGEVYEVGTGK